MIKIVLILVFGVSLFYFIRCLWKAVSLEELHWDQRNKYASNAYVFGVIAVCSLTGLSLL